MLQPNYTYKGKILNIVDGDTADIEIDVGFRLKALLRLRFNRVNTAETNSKDAQEKQLALAAKDYACANLLNQDVVITTFKADAFGRYLAEVYYMKSGVQVNYNDEVLGNGLARLYKG